MKGHKSNHTERPFSCVSSKKNWPRSEICSKLTRTTWLTSTSCFYCTDYFEQITFFFWYLISLGLKKFVVAVYKDWPDKYNTFKDKFIHLGSFFSQLFTIWFFHQSKVRKRKPLWRENTGLFFFLRFAINFFHKNIINERNPPSLLQKEKCASVKFDVSKMLFPGIEKITNR